MKVISDVLVIGSGIAGLSYALKAAQFGTVSLVTKRSVAESATYYAQGGIASVLGEDDSFEEHIADTLNAGGGLCKEDIVRMVVEDGPGRIRELMGLGTQFSRRNKDKDEDLDLGREGGHSKRRIVHSKDLTGREVEEALVRAVEREKNISLFEGHIAIDLITHSKFVKTDRKDRCWGAYVLEKETSEVRSFLSRVTVLATGGAGKVYLVTSNPDVASGDGIAMGFRAGAAVANMEFMQFHPTCLFHPDAKAFLISEAVRGEGGVLRLRDGTPFMERYHAMKDLAPRDIVARAIDFELKRSGDECVYLDISHRPAMFTRERFPYIFEKALSFGFDMTTEPLPVVPAAHYLCGGVLTDSYGESTLGGLFAIGECACTGLHGANRLASNSLLEALVFANRAVIKAADILSVGWGDFPVIPEWRSGRAVASDEAVVITHNWDEIRRFMWNYVGIVRSTKRLERAGRRIDNLKKEINSYYWDFNITADLIELRNISVVAELIIRSAMIRKESRGFHYTIDYPSRDDANWLKDTILQSLPKTDAN